MFECLSEIEFMFSPGYKVGFDRENSINDFIIDLKNLFVIKKNLIVSSEFLIDFQTQKRPTRKFTFLIDLIFFKNFDLSELFDQQALAL